MTVHQNHCGSELARDSAPRDPRVHLFETELGPHLLVADGSRVYGIDLDLKRAIEETLGIDPARLAELLGAEGLRATGFADLTPPRDPPVRSLSLALAQKCNLACTYCYAQEGGFGGPERAMPWAVAEAAVRRLLSDATPGECTHLSFLGGEPLTNRGVLKDATVLAAELAAERSVPIDFSLTTNGTLLAAEDLEFFEQFRFAVTVSIDGVGAVHDQLRPAKGGAGTYERVVARVQPLLKRPRRTQFSARVSVTPRNLRLRETLDTLIGLGFDSVGFSPVLSSPTGRDEMERSDLAVMLDQMIDCGREYERRVLAGDKYPFGNLESALREIHRGTHRPYPCGAGAGYFGVSAEGGLYACHRFVDDPTGAMGSVDDGVNRAEQRRWLEERAVDRQEPCRSCWARYLCGGGCHHEVIHRGRPSCDYIRGWLHYALQIYVRLCALRPELIQRLAA